MTDIKTVLTKEQIEQMFLKVMGCDGGWALYEVTPGNMIQLGRAIERAVLEAAPASSAMAMQAVDAKQYRDALEKIAYMRPPGDCKNKTIIAMEVIAIDALQSKQSPVQASDAGRQG